MALELGVIAILAIIWLLLGVLARPGRKDRHAREVPATAVHVPHPRAASPAARPAAVLATELRAEVSGTEADRVLALAAAHELPAELLNRWSERFGVQRMILAVDAGLGEDGMRRHLASKTQPDWAALKVFADLARVKQRLADVEQDSRQSVR